MIFICHDFSITNTTNTAIGTGVGRANCLVYRAPCGTKPTRDILPVAALSSDLSGIVGNTRTQIGNLEEIQHSHLNDSTIGPQSWKEVGTSVKHI